VLEYFDFNATKQGRITHLRPNGDGDDAEPERQCILPQVVRPQGVLVLWYTRRRQAKLGATSDGERLFKKWFVYRFVPEMNRKFIPNAEPINTFDFTVGVDFHYNRAKGKITFCHESSTNKFSIADNDLQGQGLAPKEFPCAHRSYIKR
jgi:hypothetical protein